MWDGAFIRLIPNFSDPSLPVQGEAGKTPIPPTSGTGYMKVFRSGHWIPGDPILKLIHSRM